MDQPVAGPRDEHLHVLQQYEVLDTPPEPAFDTIAAMAALLLKTAACAINFIGADRQWTKAAVGLPAGAPPPGGLSELCAQAVLQDDILVIPDMAGDPRFAHLLPSVAGAALRFYAGVPLETREGRRIGVLCVLDPQPRALADEHRMLLRALARQVMTELDLRRSLAAERAARMEAERLLVEKGELIARNDMLMREVDHRVKNSLQVVSSMLRLHARQVADQGAARALEEAQQRIASIAAVHEQLYRASNSDVVDMAVFLPGLCQALAANRPAHVEAVTVAAEPLILDSDRAMKMGLLAGELVSNAFKHAYPADRRGSIHVALVRDGGTARLTVADDGVGLPAGFAADAGHGLGMRLVHAVLGQYGGFVRAETGPGTRFIADMPLDEAPREGHSPVGPGR
ncbi:sensor histidine kinase [Labrys wisconsinensis]|uniref:histidine kinase n=1 Tax=Labrys wisconsinensis TaxID=425677 RepID=A0ABU0J8Q8_9HYPH|nr:histidine kinase dimerization/phosphoacceptor domain -containing protein [Labrys wisconsinensis]MDQ0470664.1 two-component sensor histidine kinase [Labrys wisconsinensis]